MVSRTLTVFNPPSESQTYSAKRVHESSPRQIRKRARHAPSASVTTDTCNSSSTTTDHGTDELPDEVLVHIFHFIRDASRLARLRQVCRQWRDVIDDTSSVWRLVSFKNAQFSRFVTVRAGSLELGRRVGRKAVSIAARAGNEWASFVKLALFDGHCLRAVTKGQPIASRLVGGDLSVLKSSFPPWPLGARAELGPLGRWVGVHAARSDMCDPDLPKGAVVGIVHVRHAVRVANDAWVWTIDRAVQLKRPIRCAGFVVSHLLSPIEPRLVNMRIAVIGGGLLGCATTLNLALVQEHDQRKLTTTSASPPSDFHVTLFERTASLGAHSLSSILVQPNLHVHVGSSRTLPLPSKSTYLSDLIAAANDHLATFPLFSRRVPLPAPTHARRGAHDAAPIAHPWRFASHSRVVPSFAACQWPRFEYHVIHKGFYVLDLVYRFLRNPSWRVAAFAAFVHAALQLRTATGFVSRAVTLVQMVTMFFLTLLSPRHAVAIWQRQYSFWFTTISLLFKHGITPAISRGSSIAFIDLLVDINAKNRATCSISLDSLLVRTGLLPYVQTSAADYATSFKFDPAFVRRYLEPPIASANAGLSMRNISSLAAHFAMLDADFANSDVDVRLSTVLPNNAAMCPAFIDAARATMQVDVKLQCPVVDVSYDRELGEYVITCENGDRHCFDGIALCASPKVGEMTISTPVGDDLAELLGYHPHVAGKTDAPEEGEEEGEEVSAVRKEACSHIAVVVGHVNASYFRFSSQMNVPDLVQMSDAPSWSRFERIREEGEEAGVYRVICGADFLSSGLFAEMFQGGAEVRYYQPLSQNVYSPRVIPQNAAMDNTVPRLVLGDRFIYAAATRRLAKHPEMDALSAVNTASLFSRAVHWASNEEEEEEEEEGEGNDDNGEKRREKVGQDEDGNCDDG